MPKKSIDFSETSRSGEKHFGNNITHGDSHEIAVDKLAGAITNTKDENPARGNWSNKLDFTLSCIGYAVGLGNVWRFPYLCYSNGGGAFLIPYIIMLTVAGLPLFYLELSVGQFASLGCISIWRMSPIFKGIGYAMVVITGLVCMYYNVIITWTIFYIFASLSAIPGVPWTDCDNSWNTEYCLHYTSDSAADNTTTAGYDVVIDGDRAGPAAASVFDAVMGMTGLANYTGAEYQPMQNMSTYENGSSYHMSNVTSNATERIVKRPSEEYWNNYVLELTDGIDNLGSMRWELVGCLGLAWIVVFLCIIRGVKSSGKVVYFTALFPYCVLFVLLIRGATLPGSMDGVLFYITPKWHILKKARVWKDAAAQIFYSLGIAWGGLPTLGSYNKFHNNCHRDSLIVALCNCGTSVFAGFVIFSVIGFMAYDTQVPIEKVADEGAGLAFVAYPEAVARLPISPLWAILFFFMLFTLGLDSQFVMMETLITGLMDELSSMGSKLRKHKTKITLATCIVWFLLGLPMVTRGGMYVLQLMDWYAAGFSLCFVGLMECIVISYVYGIDKYCDDLEAMVGFRPNIYWRISWKFGAPGILGFILMFSLVSYTPCQYGAYVYPAWADAIGWMIAMLSVLLIPTYAVYYLVFVQKGSILERLRHGAKPLPEWGPALPEHRFQAGYAPIKGQSPPTYEQVVYSPVNDIRLDDRITKGEDNEETRV
ncbi:sodium- and chloride-dependent glycine transporter 1-like [Ptychodera flava]|uniref:sodium- and chloride-dependent glycine transporter 1-like n=1 Tax=Ptychodera flava TaxID=63121 RepID=UPI00396A9EB8